MSKTLTNANFPLTAEGKTMHLEVGPGDVHPRILSVGDAGRGERLSSLLSNCTSLKSHRGFITYSGDYSGTPVSIIVTGMGVPMMDFMVREATFTLPGKSAIIRLGTCGILRPLTKPGSIILAESSRFLQQNYSYPEGEAFLLSSKVQGNPVLVQLLRNHLGSGLGPDNVDQGVDLTCETFYNSQGRTDTRFEESNEALIDKMIEREPEAAAMEMETFKLYHLASTSKGQIAAAACMIGLLNRKTQEMMDFSRQQDLEREAGIAALKALAEFPLEN